MSARMTQTTVYDGDLGKVVKVSMPGSVEFDAYDRTGKYVHSFSDVRSAKHALKMEQKS